MQLPNNWAARQYQQPVFRHMLVDGLYRKRGVSVWHRRAGKDQVCLNLAAVASQIRVGTIWHMLPTQAQGRKVIWQGIDKAGNRMIDQAFPKAMRKNTNNSEMRIEMLNGSIYQVVGSDNYDALVGSNPIGVIFSEYSVADPLAWEFISPILNENDGWAYFIYTSRGQNHGKKLYDRAVKHSNWFTSFLTVDDTKRPDGTPVIKTEHIQEERDMGVSEEKIQQEYYNSWEGGMEGAYFTAELSDLIECERYGLHPHDPTKQVYTFWDIGIGDNTVITMVQKGSDGHPVVIDVLAGRNVGLEEWISRVRAKPYNYKSHYFPHDSRKRDAYSAIRLIDQAARIGFIALLTPNISRAEGINLLRGMLRVASFNESTTESFIDALKGYRRVFNKKTSAFSDEPFHNYCSDYADCGRYLAVNWQTIKDEDELKGNDIVRKIKVKGRY